MTDKYSIYFLFFESAIVSHFISIPYLYAKAILVCSVCSTVFRATSLLKLWKPTGSCSGNRVFEAQVYFFPIVS